MTDQEKLDVVVAYTQQVIKAWRTRDYVELAALEPHIVHVLAVVFNRTPLSTEIDQFASRGAMPDREPIASSQEQRRGQPQRIQANKS